jgi:hypothetical protein
MVKSGIKGTRVRTHKLKPESNDGSQKHGGHEGVRLAVVASGDTAEVFEATEEAFDAVTGFIKHLVVTVLYVSIFLGRDNGLATAFFYKVAQFIAVIAAIRNNGGSFGCGFKTLFGRNKVADIACGQYQNDRPTFIVGNRVNLTITAST